MTSTWVKGIAVSLAITLSAAVGVCEAAGAGHGHRGEMFGGPMVGIISRQLDLTDAQRTQVHAILLKERPTMRPLMQQMEQSRLQITQLELNGNFDESQVRSLATQQAQTVSDLIVQRARIESEMIQVLNADQKTKLGQILASHQQRMHNHQQTPPAAPAQ